MNKNYPIFYKYAKPAASTTFAYFQPLIRKSELYYIVAECEFVAGNDAAAIDALQAVRSQRNALSVPVATMSHAEIQREYNKEMYGEGQLFYYYKRMNITAIPNGNAVTGNITMSAERYRVPLPRNEQEGRID